MKLKDDPISILLLVGAGVLALMYAWEQHGMRTLRLAEERALAVQVDDLGAPCEAHASEFEGRALAIDCEFGQPLEIAQTTAGRARTNGFELVVVRVASDVLRCPVDALPDGCTQHRVEFLRKK